MFLGDRNNIFHLVKIGHANGIVVTFFVHFAKLEQLQFTHWNFGQ